MLTTLVHLVLIWIHTVPIIYYYVFKNYFKWVFTKVSHWEIWRREH